MHAGRKCCDWLARSRLGGFSFSYVNDVFNFERSGDSSLMKMFLCPILTGNLVCGDNCTPPASLWLNLFGQLDPAPAVPNIPTVSMDVKQHFNNNFREKEELELKRENLDSQRIIALGPAGPV